MRKYLWYCFPKGIVKITGNLQKHGYKAGSNIEIILKCINDTSYRINSLIISLTIETLCILNEKSDLYKKIANIEMSYLKIGAIQAYEKRKFQRMLLIPPIQPWSSDGCEMFKIIYYLKVQFLIKYMKPHCGFTYICICKCDTIKIYFMRKSFAKYLN